MGSSPPFRQVSFLFLSPFFRVSAGEIGAAMFCFEGCVFTAALLLSTWRCCDQAAGNIRYETF
ncbi:hypothetical protein [Cupriavidus sp. TMH.W2]|uniref:hypothetical protein n=1 Tax=Cupriavidus sp. TMH.W2 TaxID=3434465 RepID=UPI003D77F70C